MSLLLYSQDNWSLCAVASLWISYHNNDLCKELKNLFRATDKNINKPWGLIQWQWLFKQAWSIDN